MPGPWITNATLKQLVADSLKKNLSDLKPYWDDFVNSANVDAVADINSILQGKGYDTVQIDAWDYVITYNKDIGLYLALLKGAAVDGSIDITNMKELDRRKRLEESVGIIINGVLVLPQDADNPGGGASGGNIDDSGYRFNMKTRF